MPEPYTRFTLDFESDRHEIDAEVYGKVLVHTNRLIDEIANEFERGARLRLTVHAEKPGSYETDLALQAGAIIGTASQFITAEHITTAVAFAKDVVSTVVNVFKFRKELGEDKIKGVSQEGETCMVTTGSGNTINITKNVYNIINNPAATQEISEIFSTLDDEPNLKGLKLLDENREQVFKATKPEFKRLSAPLSPNKEENKERIVRRKRAVLHVAVQSFEKGQKSKFYWVGNPIHVTIADPEFWKSIDGGERFAKGDELVAELEITEKFNTALNTWERKGYKATKILEHRPRPYQRLLGS